MQKYKIFNNDCLKQLDEFEENSIDCIVTDPPYELGFMGKDWDNAGVSFSKDTWAKCLRVLKPGGYLLAFGGTRTQHRIACAIEDAGFEIRDCIMWLYGGGFPKSMNIGLAVDKKLGNESKVVGVGRSGSAETHTRCMNSQTKGGKDVFGGEFEIKEAQNEWKGFGTALKPAYEPIIMARKPFKGTLVNNVLENRVGGLNIDECRVEIADEKDAQMYHFNNNGNTRLKKAEGEKTGMFDGGWRVQKEERENPQGGRFPANIILDTQEGEEWRRYFYCPKASKRDRDEGLDNFEAKEGHAKGNGLDRVCEFCGVSQLKPELCKCPTKSWVAKPQRNFHPTVKPTALMQYLVRLVAPKGATILDPFMGSGSTGKAVMFENNDRDANYTFIGIEQDKDYCEIAKARIAYASDDSNSEN